MGGFKLVRADDEVLLDDESFCIALGIRRRNQDTPRFAEIPGIAFPAITTAEIRNKGKEISC